MRDITFSVQSISFLTKDVFELKLFSKEVLPAMHAGQFVHIKVNDPSVGLRRPFCLYKFDANSVTLMIAVVGKGTEALARLKKGDKVLGIVPLGNGFKLSGQHQTVALIGGGIGCAPLLAVPSCYPGRTFNSYLGFCNKDQVMLQQEFEKVSHATVSTDDGSHGFKGYTSDAFLADYRAGFKPDVILTCGPLPMIKAVAKISLETGIPAYMSGETRMGCGVGACLVCTCAVRENGVMKNKRACVDGPVFLVEDLAL